MSPSTISDPSLPTSTGKSAKKKFENLLEMTTMNCLIGRRYASLVAVIICFLVGIANGDVVLIGRNLTLSFDDTEAAFGKNLFVNCNFPQFLCILI